MLITDIQCINYKNGVPFVVWTFWSGEEMEGNRKLSFETLIKNIGVPVYLVTPQNWHHLELANSPFHPALHHLSIVHQSDYIRIYLLHHFGGAWHDVKATEVNLSASWQAFENPNIYMVGKKEVKNGAANVFDTHGRWMPDYYHELIAVTSWIGRKHTPLSTDLFNSLNLFLDGHLSELKKHPAKHPRERALKAKNFLNKTLERMVNTFVGRQSNYPLPWTVFGNLFHPINLKYKDHIDKSLPVDKVKNAGIYHR